MDDRHELSMSSRLRQFSNTKRTNTPRSTAVATCAALLLGALACDGPTRPVIERPTLLSAHSRPIAISAMEWTTELGTFTRTPQPSDASILAGLWAISPSGDSSVGVTWQQSGPPFSEFANMVGYMTEDLTRVYRIGFPSYPRGINDAGDVVGYAYDTTAAGNPPHGWLFHDGEYRFIDFHGAKETRAFGINNAGDIVGVYIMPDGVKHQFVYANGSFASFDLPDSFGACNTSSRAINSSGVIVGRYQAPRSLLRCGGPWRGFVREPDGSTFTVFDTSTEVIESWATGINDRGDIVGAYRTLDPRLHGFLLPGNGASAITIDNPGPGGTEPEGIDKSGQIIVGIFWEALTGAAGSPFKLRLCGAHCGNPH